MPTPITHAVFAAALVAAFPEKAVPRHMAIIGAVCSMVPDLDVLGFAEPFRDFRNCRERRNDYHFHIGNVIQTQQQ